MAGVVVVGGVDARPTAFLETSMRALLLKAHGNSQPMTRWQTKRGGNLTARAIAAATTPYRSELPCRTLAVEGVGKAQRYAIGSHEQRTIRGVRIATDPFAPLILLDPRVGCRGDLDGPTPVIVAANSTWPTASRIVHGAIHWRGAFSDRRGRVGDLGPPVDGGAGNSQARD